MAKVKIFLDPIANSMNIWWNNPSGAFSSEETDDKNSNDVIIKNKKGQPIGLEVIGVFPSELNVAKMLPKVFGIKKNEPYLLTGKSD